MDFDLQQEAVNHDHAQLKRLADAWDWTDETLAEAKRRLGDPWDSTHNMLCELCAAQEDVERLKRNIDALVIAGGFTNEQLDELLEEAP
jgi:hypothetical protein